ncbi:MAG: glycoside hydrolase family 99-like domain-containing protein [Planctomycetaceae bacterium]
MNRRALVASYHVPQPDRDSGGRRHGDLIRFLVEAGWSVDVVALHGLAGADDSIRHLNALGVAVHDDAPRARRDGTRVRNPLFENLVSQASFDLAVLAFWPVARFYLPTLRRRSPRTRVLVDSVDLHFLRDARRIVGSRAAAAAGTLLDADFAAEMTAELNAYAAADGVLTVSDKERDLLRDFLGASVSAGTVPDCEDAAPSPVPMRERSGILLLGSFQHAPNVEAFRFFCGEVLPLLDRRLLDRHPVYVVGNGVTDEVRDLAAGDPAIRLVGWVPDIAPYFDRVRCSVVPLLHGAGTKRKLVQALMHGTPTVSTTVGIEGLDLVDGTHVLVADRPSAIAEGLERLLSDEPFCERLATAGLDHVAASRSREAARTAFAASIDDVLATDPKPNMLPEFPVADYDARWGRLEAGESARRKRLTAHAESSRRPNVGGVADAASAVADASGLRLIAFHLPQFHPIPENDLWWGKGFTEWRNVGKAEPLFPGQHQPQLPADLGFYDLRLTESRIAQADLARRHGIHGFCHYHYWFQGKRLLERPVADMLATGEPDFPFCLCWANEPWSRRWDGSDSEILQPQHYSAEDDLAHIRWLLGPLADPRAIRIHGRPVFMVYRGDQLPEPARTIDCWRREVERAGLPGLYLVAVETGWDAGWDAIRVGFDAKVLFQPQFSLLEGVPRLPLGPSKTRVFDYDAAWPVLAAADPVPYLRFDTVCPGWDNTARKGEDAWVLHGNTPASYERWLTLAIGRAMDRPAEERIVFINAWNEWAEGAHLEPDRRDGRGFLEATLRAVRAGAAP